MHDRATSGSPQIRETTVVRHAYIYIECIGRNIGYREFILSAIIFNSIQSSLECTAPNGARTISIIPEENLAILIAISYPAYINKMSSRLHSTDYFSAMCRCTSNLY